MSYLSDTLINSIKIKASVPTSQSLFTNQSFLDLINEEIQTNIVPELMRIKEEYFSTKIDVQLLDGVNSYSIPERAIGGMLRDVQIVESGTVYSLPRLYQEDQIQTTEQRQGFYLEGNNIIVSPTPIHSNDILRISVYQRPSKVVLSTECAQITSIDTTLNQVIVTSLPSNITSNELIDLVRNKPGFECLEIDKTISGISGLTISFTSLPSKLAVGDWICLSGESPIAQIPVEVQPVLTQAVVVKCLESMGDSKMKIAEEKLQMMKQKVFGMISPRVDGENKKIINNHSLLNHIRR
jgi:hypothetical protein